MKAVSIDPNALPHPKTHDLPPLILGSCTRCHTEFVSDEDTKDLPEYTKNDAEWIVFPCPSCQNASVTFAPPIKFASRNKKTNCKTCNHRGCTDGTELVTHQSSSEEARGEITSDYIQCNQEDCSGQVFVNPYGKCS